jgi:putative transposase
MLEEPPESCLAIVSDLAELYYVTFTTHAGHDRERRLRQPTQHPIGIYSEGFWKQKMDYLHHNSCRKGLALRPEDGRFSSALYWTTREACDVQVSEVGWE